MQLNKQADNMGRVFFGQQHYKVDLIVLDDYVLMEILELISRLVV
jgi:hypothetical protein